MIASTALYTMSTPTFNVLLLLPFVLILIHCPLLLTQSVFNPSTYGAYPDDGVDDTTSLQSAIDAAIRSGPGATVQLLPGTYDLNATLQVHNCHSFTFNGSSPSSTLLLLHAATGALAYSQCSNLTFSHFSIDFAPLYWSFTAGFISNVSTTSPYSLDVAVTAPHLPLAGVSASAIFVYDPVNMRPASGPSTYEIFQSVPTLSTIVAPGVVRFALQSRGAWKVGQPVVVRYVGGPHVISGEDVLGLRMQSMVVYTSWDMSHASNRVHNLRVVDYHVRRGEGRWLSTWADCLHFADHREAMEIVDSSCEGMGDDGLNVHSYFFNATQLLNATTVVVSLTKAWEDTLSVGVGTSMAFAHAATPFVAYGSYQVAALREYSSTSFVYTFTAPVLGVEVGDIVYVNNPLSLLLSNFTVKNNRARGVLLELHNVTIDRCLFQHTSGPALLFQPSFFWGEAEPGANATVRETVFDGCNEGIAQQEGVISILPDPVQVMGVIDDITVERSTFLQGPYSQGLLQSYNGKRVTLRNNWVGNVSASGAAIYVCNSEGLTVQRNRVWNGTRVGWALDGGGVCKGSLSTGLNFTADAFNATFGPVVMPSPSGYGVVLVRDVDVPSTGASSGSGSTRTVWTPLGVLIAAALALWW